MIGMTFAEITCFNDAPQIALLGVQFPEAVR